MTIISAIFNFERFKSSGEIQTVIIIGLIRYTGKMKNQWKVINYDVIKSKCSNFINKKDHTIVL